MPPATHPHKGLRLSPQRAQRKETDMHKAEHRQRWKWAEGSIWTDNVLAALENGVKGGKWFSLIDKVFSQKTLLKAAIEDYP